MNNEPRCEVCLLEILDLSVDSGGNWQVVIPMRRGSWIDSERVLICGSLECTEIAQAIVRRRQEMPR